MPFHKLVVIGKLVSDPKSNEFQGGRVAHFGLPIDFTRRKKNPETGQWEGDSFIINVDVFNRDNRPLADWVMQSLKKGSQVYVEGRLRNNEYTDKNNVKVARPVLVADVIEFLDARPDGMAAGEGGTRNFSSTSPVPPRQVQAPAPSRNVGSYDDYEEPPSRSAPPPGRSSSGGGSHGGEEDEIPF